MSRIFCFYLRAYIFSTIVYPVRGGGFYVCPYCRNWQNKRYVIIQSYQEKRYYDIFGSYYRKLGGWICSLRKEYHGDKKIKQWLGPMQRSHEGKACHCAVGKITHFSLSQSAYPQRRNNVLLICGDNLFYNTFAPELCDFVHYCAGGDGARTYGVIAALSLVVSVTVADSDGGQAGDSGSWNTWHA